jgi:RNA polymerase sigma-70 factor (ECF subfamily)
MPARPFSPQSATPRPATLPGGGAAAVPPSGAEPPRLAPEQMARFKAVVLPHLDSAYNLARYLVRDPVAAEDIVQDAFIRALRAFEGYRGGDARAWLLAIVRNRCMTWLRTSAHDPLSGLTDGALPEGVVQVQGGEGWPPGGEAETPETLLLRRGDSGLMTRLLQALPESFRDVLVLRELEELSYREIAGVIGAPIGTVMSRLARARSLLARAWRQSEGGGE